MPEKIWFKDWFNSPYYYVLYKNRDDKEASAFMDTLINHLKLNSKNTIWDLACGKGRHSLYLNSKGLNVIGTDLSRNSINEAKKSENDTLEFFIHDMRTPFRINYFTHVLNLFTSIGYFENERDNLKVFKIVFNALKPGGIFVVDFFNVIDIEECMVAENKTNIEGIDFRICKSIAEKKVIKRIEFSDKGKDYYFEEKVSLFTKTDFEKMGASAGFKLSETFGDYQLNPFDEKNSDRLILIFKK
ncbi:MAG TPA: class I SAM-dependent methyltransferase [Bacteroidia bacterium]|jgi:SAM-dependent methyltransferase|nr:class I SAM-dependent methyltransferase [Bacteroidia bacterium]